MSELTDRAEAVLANPGYMANMPELSLVRDLLAEVKRTATALETSEMISDKIEAANHSQTRVIDALQAKIDAMRDLHRPDRITDDWHICHECSMGGPYVDYPCDTVKALGEP